MTNKTAPSKPQKSSAEYFKAAKEFQAQGQDEQALKLYLQALAIEPQLCPALSQLGIIYEAQEQFERAINYYQQVIKLQPQNSLAYFRLGRAMLRHNKIPAAINAYKKAISLNLDSPAWVYHGWGDALMQDGQTKNAIAAYRKALNQNPVNPTEIKRKINAALDLSRATPLNPLNTIARQIAQEAPYTGGPIQHFEQVGRETIITLLQNGLRPDCKLLDFGCGALRLGYWLILARLRQLLWDRARYFDVRSR